MFKKLKIPAMVLVLAALPIAFTGAKTDSPLGIVLTVTDGCADAGKCCYNPGSVCSGGGGGGMANHIYRAKGCEKL